MGYEEDRQKRIDIFEDTLRLCESEPGLRDAVKHSMDNTVLYRSPSEEPMNSNDAGYDKDCGIRITRLRTFESAGRLCREYPDMRIGVLNFASATRPGGGVVNGSAAQEECLCRCSTLYPCLNTPELKKEFYDFHIERHDTNYTDSLIYTPDIVVMKSDVSMPQTLSEDEWFKVDVLTCAAPNLRENRYAGRSGMQKNLSKDEIQVLLQERTNGIIRVAAANNIDILVLGAFGCGVFANDPVMVAECFKNSLERYGKAFRVVEFAVYCPPDDDGNYEAFKNVLS